MANENDERFVMALLKVPEDMQIDFFRKNSYRIRNDSNYWNILGSLWKFGGSVIQQDSWKELLLAPRKNSHKIMKNRERSTWRRLPAKVRAYRAVNHDGEHETAISWTLSKKVAEKFSGDGKRKVVCREFRKSEIFAYFDRRNEEEILVNISASV